MAIKRPTDRNTKTEILLAFDELLKEKKALETQLAAKPVENPRNGKAAPIPESAPSRLAPPNPQKMEAIVAELNQLQLNFGGAVSDLSEKLTLEAVKLQAIRQSVTEEVQQLETLHNLQVIETSLDDLIQQYETQSKAYNEELSQRRETVEQEITDARKAWTKEQDNHRRSIKERNETTTKTQQRDVQEYNYDLNLVHKLDTEAAEQEKKQLYQALEELRQAQAKQWADREKVIADRETRWAELKAKVEAMPKDLETAVKRAKEEGKGIAYHQAKVKADLLAKEVEGSKRTYELRLQSLLATIENQDGRIQTLSKQLDAALKQVQDLAVKAIEGASNASSFQAVKEIAIEQAKNPNKNK